MATGRQRAVLGSINRLFRSGTATGLSDGQLLERFATRHDEAAEAAFAALVERHGPMVLAVCRRVLNDPHDALDAFQATFLVLVRKAGAVRNRESVASWLYGVARRVSKHARSTAARRIEVERIAGTASARVFDERVRDLEVWEEVDRLSEPLRLAVVHCYLQGLTHEQAAARLGWPVGTVRSRLARARERLRARLTRRGLAPGALLLPMLSPESTRLPITLIDPTVRAALLFVARDAAEAGLVSASAASLTEGVLRTMFLFKLKTAAVAVLAAASLAAGAAVYGYQSPTPSALPGAAAAEVAYTLGHINVDEAVTPIDDLGEDLSQQIIELAKSARDSHQKGDREASVKILQKMQAATGRWMAQIKTSEVWKMRLDSDVQLRKHLEEVKILARSKGAEAADAARSRMADLTRKLVQDAEKLNERITQAGVEAELASAPTLNEAEKKLIERITQAGAEAELASAPTLNEAEKKLTTKPRMVIRREVVTRPLFPIAPKFQTPGGKPTTTSVWQTEKVIEVAETQRRLEEVERKLDRILKRLDESSTPPPASSSDRKPDTGRN